jgi:hypothetical protein
MWKSQKPHTQTRRDGAPEFVSGFIVRATRHQNSYCGLSPGPPAESPIRLRWSVRAPQMILLHHRFSYRACLPNDSLSSFKLWCRKQAIAVQAPYFCVMPVNAEVPDGYRSLMMFSLGVDNPENIEIGLIQIRAGFKFPADIHTLRSEFLCLRK